MHQTTSGETLKPKVEVKKINTKDFLINQNSIFEKMKNLNVFYDNNLFVKDSGINYFQINNLSKENSHLNAIIRKEYNDCEKIFPRLGVVFLSFLFQSKAKISKNKWLIDKIKIKSILSKEKNSIVKEIIKTYIENCNLEYIVSIEENYLNNIVIEKNNNIVFKNKFDKDFFNKDTEYSDYKVCIIDGYIDSVGEIHHLLQKSSENKLCNYVIFCYGMSQDVKKTIIINNQKRNTRIFPISFEYSEENLNILNDISVLHKVDIISSSKGQTISQALRNKLKKSKRISISISNNSFTIEPNCEISDIKKHVKFLRKKSLSNINQKNNDLINKRIKALTSKHFKIFLPKIILKDNEVISKINYYFNFLSNLKLTQRKIYIDNNEYYLPDVYIKHSQKKASSIKEILKDIDVLVQEV